jgi:hypothetical protein
VSVVVPDYFEPVVGWRTWLVVEHAGALRLRSVAFETLWHPLRELTAHCEAPRRLWQLLKPAKHEAPAFPCQCGIYAARDVAEAIGYLTVYDDLLAPVAVHRVIGRVSLWGSVVEADLGWRASRAYPSEIYVPPPRSSGRFVDVHAIADGLGSYRVPIDVVADGGPIDDPYGLAAALRRAAA